MTFDPRIVRARREKLLLRLLFRSTDAMNAAMAERIRARGFPEFQPSFTGLLVHVDTEGTRIGVVASRMHVSRQAASQAIREIERRGFLERHADAADGRATIVRHTAAGKAVLLVAIEVMLEIEGEYRGILGDTGFTRLVDLLARLVERIDPQGQLG